MEVGDVGFLLDFQFIDFLLNIVLDPLHLLHLGVAVLQIQLQLIVLGLDCLDLSLLGFNLVPHFLDDLPALFNFLLPRDKHLIGKGQLGMQS